jgi:sRNA-binding protein
MTYTTEYRFSSEEKNEVIQMLAEKYPKCFFLNPKLRRPLKKTIVANLMQEGLPRARELLAASVDWYRSHVGYQLALQAGQKRIDLNGKDVGTVTELEERTAKKQAEVALNDMKKAAQEARDAKKRAYDEKRNAEPPPVQYGTLIPQFPKNVEPPLMSKVEKKVEAPPMNPPLKSEDLKRFYDKSLAAVAAISAVQNTDMLAAITVAAMAEVIKAAQSLIDNASSQSSTP